MYCCGARTQESSAPSGHLTRKSRVPFSFARVSSTAAGSTSSNRLSAQSQINISADQSRSSGVLSTCMTTVCEFKERK